MFNTNQRKYQSKKTDRVSVIEEINLLKEKSPENGAFVYKSVCIICKTLMINVDCGPDGTRTRDLRRDRAAF